MVVLSPSKKRASVTICDETFSTQAALIRRVKSIFEKLNDRQNQTFIQAFVSTYDKVIRQNKELKNVYYGPNDCIPSHFKHSNCLHCVFTDESEITVGYKNVVTSCFDPDGTALRVMKDKQIAIYRSQIYHDILDFRINNIKNGCAICKTNFDEYDSPCPHVDHCGEKEFRHIVKDFENQTDENDFAKFHRKHAQYQILCEDCHYKKPNRW